MQKQGKSWQLNNLQPKGQGMCNTVIETYKAKVKETVTRQLKKLQPKGQGNCNQAIEES